MRSVMLSPARILFWLALLGLMWLVVTFLYVPLLTVLDAAFTKEGAVTSETILRLMASRNVQASLFTTLWITAITLVTVNIVGLFQVAVLEFFEIRGSAILKVAFATPLVFASVTAITGYSFAYGSSGAVTGTIVQIFPDMDKNWFRGGLAILIAHSFLMTHYHFLFLRAAIRRVDFSIVEAARSLGASPVGTLLRIVLPVIAPMIFAVTLLVLLNSLTSFAAPALLGGRDYRMINQMILALNSIRRTDMAAMLALLLGTVSLIVFLLLRWVEHKGRYVGGAKTPVPMRKIALRNRWGRWLVHALAYGLAVIYLIPVLLTIAFSFAPSQSIAVDIWPSGFTLANYKAVLFDGRAVAPLINSVIMSLMSVAGVLCVALFASHLIATKRNFAASVLEFSLFIPWVLPSSLVAIGLITAFDAPNWLIFDRVLLGSYEILPIAYGILIIPMMIRLIGSAMVGLDASLNDAARALGAGPFYSFRRITLPLLAPVLILVSAMAFNDLVNEYTVSAFLYNTNNTPLGVAIAAGAASNDPEITAKTLVYATLVMGFSFFVIMLADRIGLGKSRLSPV